MGNINTSISMNINTNKNAMGSRAAVMNQPGAAPSGARGGAVRLSLPRGSYTIDGDGNLTIHGGGVPSVREIGETPSPLCPGLSYGRFMEKAGGCGAESRMGEGGDPFGMDFTAFGIAPEELVRECRGTVYGYARCSTVHQDYQRQVDALLKLGIREENIFKDKKSGKDFNREEFQKLMLALQPGDCIVVVELDRFGRSMTEIKKQWFWITQQKQADIVVLDQPVLNTRLGAHGLGAFLADLILAVFSLMAEIERKLINKRMEAGIRQARMAGKKLGRKPMAIPQLFWKLKEKFLGGQISQNAASQELGVDPKTFRSWVERTGEVSDAQGWEAQKAGIEGREKEERIRRARMEYGEVAGSAAAEMGQGTEAGEAHADVEAGRVAEAECVDVETGRETEAECVDAEAGRETEAECADAEAGRETEAECADAEAGRKVNAKRVGTAVGRDMPTGSGRSGADGGPGHLRQTVGKSPEAAGRVGHGAAGNFARADDGAVGKGRRNHRTSKCQKLHGEAERKPDSGRKLRPKSSRI